jgi:hypothetical protein
MNLVKTCRIDLSRLSMSLGGGYLLKSRECLMKADNILTTEKPTNLKAGFFLTEKSYVYYTKFNLSLRK